MYNACMMGNEDTHDNILSQEEIDKLSGDVSNDSDSQNEDKNINISSMLSQDEIDAVAGNLDELSSMNDNNTDVTGQESKSLDTKEDKEDKEDKEAPILLSQDDLDKLEMENIDEDKKEEREEKTDKESDVQNDISSTDNNTNDDSNGSNDLDNKDKDKDSTKKSLKSKKKFIIAFIVIIILFIIGYFMREFFILDKKENLTKNEELANNEEVFIDNKSNVKDKKNRVKKSTKVSKIKPYQNIRKGISLFFTVYNKKKNMEDVVMKSEELIVAHDMDISEEKLKICLAFDLTASLIETDIAKKNKRATNKYFQFEKMNKRYKKRLTNAGYNSNEADKLILKWGKKTIEFLKEKFKQDSKLLKKNQT